tara:strand:+ start:277 stop:540 length:264 start_codon:yes stop_codon:yes gene_type:complete
LLLLNRKKICPANDDDDDDAAASEIGALFSPTQAKSLSLFLSSTKHPTFAREKNFFRDENEDLSLTSLFFFFFFFFFFERARREHTF